MIDITFTNWDTSLKRFQTLCDENDVFIDVYHEMGLTIGCVVTKGRDRQWHVYPMTGYWNNKRKTQ